MEYVQLTMEDYIQSKAEIRKDLGGIAKGFVRVGWRLTRIHASGAYKMDGYKTIAEFARAEYDISPDGVSRFMNVYEKYSVPGDTPELREEYRDFKFAQLTEMLQVSEEDRAMFRAEAKRESIREFRKFTKENENSPDGLLNWQKEPEDLIKKTILEFYHKNRDILNELYGSEAYTSGNLKDMVEIINPSGNRHFRHKMVFLMMYDYEKGLMVSEFGKDPEGMAWEKFFAITQEIFSEAAAGNRTWEAYFETETVPVQKEEAEDEQIPGQDHVLNHPEYLPETKEAPGKTGGKETEEIAPAQKPEEEFEPAPDNMISLCYSCEHWTECNAKSNTVKECNEYICKAEKTREQEYGEEQDKIDRETRKKLREKEQEEKMRNLPSDTRQETHQIRLASSYYDDVAAGRRTFELRKNDRHYKIGDTLEMLEFKDGRNTGRTICAEVTYILEDHTGLEDGYCILAIKVEEADE